MIQATSESIAAQVRQVPRWFHSIRLTDSLVTPGFKSPEILDREWRVLQLGNLAKKSVLDIGAWDGYFSFRAEREGADRVTALDHFSWAMDWSRAAEDGIDISRADSQPTPAFDMEQLPGRRGFELARRVFGSKVEDIAADFMSVDIGDLGQHNVVLFLGVLYHIKDPLEALRRVHQMTGDFALIETEAICAAGFEHAAICEFFPGDERNEDPTNWWAPNLKGLIALCSAAGFSRVDVLKGPKPRSAWAIRRLFSPKSLLQHGFKGMAVKRYRAVVRAWP